MGSRRMIYPYTLSAKLAQFPYKFYFNNPRSWIFRYLGIAVVLNLPLFYKIQQLSRSPENIKKWDEIHRKEREDDVEEDDI